MRKAAIDVHAYGLSVGSGNASGIALPSTVSGWNLIYANDFNTSFAVGGVDSTGTFPSPYSADLWCYGDGSPDTAGGVDFGANSIYQPTDVLSCSGSVIRKNLHIVGGVPHSAVIGVSPGGVSNQTYGRYSACFKVPSTFNGWKTAWLTFPSPGTWPTDGEIDFLEGPLNGTMGMFMHWQGGTSGNDNYGFESGISYVSTGLGNGWHVVTLEWSANYCRFILDNLVIGTVYGTKVPNTSMFVVLQTETDFSSYPTNMPTTGDAGFVDVDWIAVWSLGSYVIPYSTVPSATTLFTETFTGTNGAVWSTGNWTSVTTTTGASATIQTNRGQQATGTIGSYGGKVQRRAIVTLPSNILIQATVRFTDLAEHYPWLVFRDVSGDTQNCYVVQFDPAGSTVQLKRVDAGNDDNILHTYDLTYTLNLSLDVEIIAVGSEIYVRVWTTGGGRPSTPQLGAYDSNYTGTTFSLASIGGAATTSRTTEFDTVTLSSIP
jgi:hypothetical protein